MTYVLDSISFSLTGKRPPYYIVAQCPLPRCAMYGVADYEISGRLPFSPLLLFNCYVLHVHRLMMLELWTASTSAFSPSFSSCNLWIDSGRKRGKWKRQIHSKLSWNLLYTSNISNVDTSICRLKNIYIRAQDPSMGTTFIKVFYLQIPNILPLWFLTYCSMN